MTGALYGTETRAALRNFPFTVPPFPPVLIAAFIDVKEAAARANMHTGTLARSVAAAISRACTDIRAERFHGQFPISALQGGAGTSLNSNVNEVIATRASLILRARPSPYQAVRPNDDVNRSQSTNDVAPSALRIALLRLVAALDATMTNTVRVFRRKAHAFSRVRKLGRTHLQDAVPTTLGNTFASYASTIERSRDRLNLHRRELVQLNLGGTAIGTSVNASRAYIVAVYRELRRITHLPLRRGRDLIAMTASQGDFVALSGTLAIIALEYSKIANDLRLLASGPSGGIGEIKIARLQKGSTIMPGKVNPVLPEVLNQLYCIVTGHDTSIREAAHAAQLELGTMWPVIAQALLGSLTLMNEVIGVANRNCFATVEAVAERCRELLERSDAYAALLVPELGYDTVAAMVRQARLTRRTLREVVIRSKALSAGRFDALTQKR